MRTGTCPQPATTDTHWMRRGITHVACARTSVRSCAHLQIPHTSGLWKDWRAMREQFDFCAASAQRFDGWEGVISVLEGRLSSAVNERRSKDPRPFGLNKHFQLRPASRGIDHETVVQSRALHLDSTPPYPRCLHCPSYSSASLESYTPCPPTRAVPGLVLGPAQSKDSYLCV
jgi:hypothetical protein